MTDPSIPRFIVGMPRAGTTWLCRSLNQHREVAAFGESMFWGKGYIAPTGAGRYDTEEMVRVRKGLSSRPFETTIDVDGSGSMQRIRRTDIPGLVHSSLGGLEHASPGETFLRFCSGMAQADGKHHWIEKTPHHLIFAKRILKELPESRFVVTLREPYGFMLSYKHQPGHDASQKCARDFRHRYHPLGCALVWRNSLRAARRMLQEHSGQSMLVDLQDIVIAIRLACCATFNGSFCWTSIHLSPGCLDASDRRFKIRTDPHWPVRMLPG